MNYTRFAIFLAFFILSFNYLSGQLGPYVECLDEGDAFVGLDRKGWTNDISNASESYQLNFQIPENSPFDCALIDRVVFTINGFSDDASGSGGCFIQNWSHVLDCHDNDPISCTPDPFSCCDDPGRNNFTINNDNELLTNGQEFGFDIVAISNVSNAACSAELISMGLYSASFEVCMEIFYIEDVPEEEVDLGDDFAICADETVDIDGPNSFEVFEWDGPVRSDERDLEDAVPGFYILTATDDKGCQSTDDIEIFPHDEIEVTFEQRDPFFVCGSGNDRINVLIDNNSQTNGFDFNWTTPGATNSNDNSIEIDIDGIYTVEVIDNNTGCTITNSIEVNTSNLSIAQIDSLSVQNIISCDNSVMVEAFIPAGDLNNYSFEWVNGLDTTRTQSLIVMQTGTYILNLFNDIGCPATSDTVDINLISPLTAGQDSQGIECNNQTIDLTTFLSFDATPNGRWETNNQTTTSIQGNQLTLGNTTGLVEVNYIIMNPDPCVSDTALISLMVSPSIETNVIEDLCEGEFREAGNEIFDINNPTGTVLLTSQSGCDSIVSVDLSFSLDQTFLLDDQLCSDDFREVNGTRYDSSNTSGMETLISSAGCDSIVTIDLSFDTEVITDLDDILCRDDFREVNGTIYDINNTAGRETLVSAAGCDSIVNIDLSFIDQISEEFNLELCSDDFREINGTRYDINNPIGMEMFTSASGCDSILNIDLSFIDVITEEFNPDLCSDEFREINGTIYDINNPMGIEMFTSTSGCDSILNININFFAPIPLTIINPTLCADDFREVNGMIYDFNNQTGTEMLIGNNGCDSIINIDLDFFAPITMTLINTELCIGDTEEVNGTIYDMDMPTGIETIINTNGCDSIITIDLTFFAENPLTDENVLFCDSIFIIDEWILQEGLVIDTLSDINGCDSIINTMVTLDNCLREINVTTAELTCSDSNNGVISIELIGEFEFPISYTVDINGINPLEGEILEEGTLNLDMLLSGSYNLVLTDNLGAEIYNQDTNINAPDAIGIELIEEIGIDCVGDATGEISSIITNAIGSIRFDWSNMSSDERLTNVTSGSYTLTVSDVNGCSASATIILSEPQAITATIQESNITCNSTDGGSIIITDINGGTGPFLTSIDGVNFEDQSEYNNLPENDYTVTIMDVNGCLLQENISIIMESAFTIDALGPFAINEGESISIDLNLDFVPISIAWSPDSSLSCTDCEIAVADPLEDIVYIVTIIDPAGCELSTDISVTVEELVITDLASDDIYIPNVFSPNLQGSVDAVFRPFFSSDTDIVVTSFTIFDRYGNISHEELDGSVDGWNGFINDIVAQIGVYVYKLNYIVDGNERIEVGSFTLLR